MASISPLTLFNKTVEDTIEYLIKVFQNNDKLKHQKEELTKLKLAKEKFLIAKQYDPKKILENFFQYVYQFKEDIMKKNERFFLEEDIKKHLKKEIMDSAEKTGITEDYIITKSIDIKNYWQELTGEQKNKIWQYFQNMITCTERYVIMSMKK